MDIRQKEFSIPAGYKSIKNEIQLHVKTNLAVITGLNGCGKTTVLKYIYESYQDKNKIFFKTTSELNKRNRNWRHDRYFSKRNEDLIPTFDDIMDEVYDEFRRHTRNQQYTHRYELFSMLFDSNSTLYKDGVDFLKTLSERVLDDLDDNDAIKLRLGVPTKERIKEQIISDINTQRNLFDNRQGKKVYDDYQNNKLSDEHSEKIQKIENQAIQQLQEYLRKKSRIKDKESFENYMHELAMNYSFSIESIVEKMSKRIYEDHKAKTSRATKLWQEINNELKQYNDKGQFLYEINSPSVYSSNYEINFKPINGNQTIHYESLSSGEKIIFELVCYYFIANKNQDLDIVILDEFDANLNPALSEIYLKTVRKQFCEKGITTILTTHSPSTIAEVKPEELFELSLDNGTQIINCAKNQKGKKEILRKLAPRFVYYSEFGNLEYILKDQTNTIVLFRRKK